MDLNLLSAPIDLMFISRGYNNFSFSVNLLMDLGRDSPKEEDTYYFRFLANTGLIWKNRFGSLGGYIGTIAGEQKRGDDYHGLVIEKPEHIDTRAGSEFKFSFVYWIVPNLNLENYPFVGKIFKTLGGYINIVESSIQDYSGSLVAREFNIGPVTISSMDYYYKKQSYNIIVSREAFGASIGISDFLGFFAYKSRMGFDNILLIEGGYQRYYDFFEYNQTALYHYDQAYLRSLYADSPFIKLSLLWLSPGDNDSKISLGALWDGNYSILPKLSFNFTLGLFSAMGLDMLEGSVFTLFLEYGYRIHKDKELRGEQFYGVSEFGIGVSYMIRK